jgi:CDP-4-dehydro-6-deoxyglucose reductase, E3
MLSPRSNGYEMEVQEKTWLNHSVIRLRLSPRGGNRMAYQSGQFLSVVLPDGTQRSYSMANRQTDDGTIELHIRYHEHGKFSNLLQHRIERGSRLDIQGPYGDCVWAEPLDPASLIVMLATGTGLAPLIALLEQAIHSGCLNPIWLYWGGVTSEDFYFSTELQALERQYQNFHYIPVLSQPEPVWAGEVGYVQQVAARDHADLNTAYVYVCGAPAMVQAAKELLTQTCDLPEAHFFADAFEPSAAKTLPAVSALIEVRMRKGKDEWRSLQLSAGQSLMEGLRSGGYLQGVCGGRAACGTCRVGIDPLWLASLEPASRTEQCLLATLDDAQPNDRLACQVMLSKAHEGLDFTLPDHPW